MMFTMKRSYDFRAVGGPTGASPLTNPPVKVGETSVDRDGFPIEGANPPFLAMKETPFPIEFSHATPADIYPSSKDFFEKGDAWETADVLSGRSALRNLARCSLFPVDDYFCREFIIDAAFVKGKLMLQRHPDDAISKQEEGYGSVFEKAMATPGHPEAHAFHEFVTYAVGEHSLLVRAETDCLDKKSLRPIGLTTKKVKRNKKGGYYDLASANYYQEQWLQMVLSGTAYLIIGARDEGLCDTGRASITKLYSLTPSQAAEKGELSAARQQQVFDSLARVLTWIKRCFSEAASGSALADGMAQAKICFSKADGAKSLTFTIQSPAQHVEFLPAQIVDVLNAL